MDRLTDEHGLLQWWEDISNMEGEKFLDVIGKAVHLSVFIGQLGCPSIGSVGMAYKWSYKLVLLRAFSASTEELEKSVDVKPDVKPRVKQELITDHLKVEKKRKPHDRFNGTSKEELMTRTLPDRLKENLDIVFIGEYQK